MVGIYEMMHFRIKHFINIYTSSHHITPVLFLPGAKPTAAPVAVAEERPGKSPQ